MSQSVYKQNITSLNVSYENIAHTRDLQDSSVLCNIFIISVFLVFSRITCKKGWSLFYGVSNKCSVVRETVKGGEAMGRL